MHAIMNEVRASILAGRFQSARQDFLKRYGS
jgi:queuine/archaeosine tRNA-ribosyltransferase